MKFLGQNPVRCKIVVDNRRLQVKNFKFLGCDIWYGNEKNIQRNIENFSQILEISNETFKSSLVRKFSKIYVYNALTVPILLHSSKIWTLRK
jgi:hypothetical protein